MPWLLGILLLGAFPQGLRAQFLSVSDRLKFERVGPEQGLSQVSVYVMLEDSRGFVWMGTEDGLNRYDGLGMKVFQNLPEDSGSLAENTVYGLCEGPDGSVWVATAGGGVDRWDRASQRFSHHRHAPDDSLSLPTDMISKLACLPDDPGAVWVGTHGKGLCRLDVATGRVRRLPFGHEPGKGLVGSIVNFIEQDLERPNWLWVGTERALNLYDREAGRFESSFAFGMQVEGSFLKGAHDMVQNEDGTAWLALMNQGLLLIDRETGRILEAHGAEPGKPGLAAPDIWAIERDAEGNLWVGYFSSGLSCLTRQERQWVHFRNTPDPRSLSNDEVRSLLSTRSGGLFVGTYTGGANLLGKVASPFYHFQQEPFKDNSLNSNVILSFLKQGSTLWVGTWGGGLNRLDLRQGRFSQFRHDEQDPASISSDFVLCVVPEPGGKLWLGTNGGGLCLLDTATGRATRYRHRPGDPGALPNDEVWHVAQDPQNPDWLWVATYEGLARFDKRRQRFEPAPGLESLGKLMLWRVQFDTRGQMWLCTNGHGLLRYHWREQRFEQFSLSNGRLSYDEVWLFHPGPEGSLWVGTNGGGLCQLWPETGEFRQWAIQDGLPSNVVYGILEDGRGHLWLSTTKGISRFDPREGRFRTFRQLDGLQADEFNATSFFQDENGFLYFGGINGFNIFHPDRVGQNAIAPQVAITDFYLYHGLGSGDFGALLESGHIELEAKQNYFSIEFAALHYAAPRGNRLAYMLEGFDTDWIMANPERRLATYTNLDPGRYVFKVKAANSDGLWNERPATLELVIVPPLWRKPWFIATLLAMSLALAVAYVKYRELRLRLEKTRLEGIVEERISEVRQQNIMISQQSEALRRQRDDYQLLNATKDRFFSILAHDLRNPFNLFINLSEYLFENHAKLARQELESHLEALNETSRQTFNLLENLLEWARSQTGGLEIKLKPMRLREAALMTVPLLEQMARGKHIRLEADVPDELWAVADLNLVNTVLRNLLSNALKFTPEGGQVLLRARADAKSVYVSVADDGVGIPEKTKADLFRVDVSTSTQGTGREKGSGLGLILCHEFVRQCQGEIWVEDNPQGKGTVFTFSLPRAQAPPQAEPSPSPGRVSIERVPLPAVLGIQKLDHELLEILDHFAKLFQELAKSRRIKSIIRAGERLEELGREAGMAEFEDYGRQLRAEAGRFEVDKLEARMEAFALMVERLKLENPPAED